MMQLQKQLLSCIKRSIFNRFWWALWLVSTFYCISHQILRYNIYMSIHLFLSFWQIGENPFGKPKTLSGINFDQYYWVYKNYLQTFLILVSPVAPLKTTFELLCIVNSLLLLSPYQTIPKLLLPLSAQNCKKWVKETVGVLHLEIFQGHWTVTV